LGKVVGIDLGTTNSLVAYVKDGRAGRHPRRSGDALVPSSFRSAKTARSSSAAKRSGAC
jgi:molecular chaperone DnaK (HSP70)